MSGNPTGRPTKYNVDRATMIIARIRRGSTKKAAAAAVRVSYSTLNHWMDRGKKSGKANAVYREFREQVSQAYAQAEVIAVETVTNAIIAGDPKIALEWLARARYKDWGKKERHDVSLDTSDGPAVIFYMPTNGRDDGDKSE